MSTPSFVVLHLAIFGGAGYLAQYNGYAAMGWVAFAVGAITVYERLHGVHLGRRR